MVTRNGASGVPSIILIGGGSAFKSTCPVLVRSIRAKDSTRDVKAVIVERDQPELEALKDQMKEIGVETLGVYLRSTPSIQATLAKKIEELQLQNIDPGTNTADCPPIVRALIHVQADEIIQAVKRLLPKRQNGLLNGNVIICTAFSLTGPTSSIVGLEAVPLVMEGLKAWRNEFPLGHIGEITSIGFAVVAPNPEEGASDYGLRHGDRAARHLQEAMSRADEGSHPFYRCLLLDGSGFGSVIGLNEYLEWIGEAAGTFLTARNENGELVGDPVEMHRFLPDDASYSNMILVRAGCAAMDVESVKAMVNLSQDKLDQPLPQHLSDLEKGRIVEVARQAVIAQQKVIKERKGNLLGFGEKKEKDKNAAELRKRTDYFKQVRGGLVKQLDEDWRARDYGLMWMMPRFESLLQQAERLTVADSVPYCPTLVEMESTQKQEFHDEVGVLTLIAVTPRSDTKLSAFRIMIMGTRESRSEFGINETNLRDVFFDPKNNTDDKVAIDLCFSNDPYLLSYILMWRPISGPPMPRYYEERPDYFFRPLPPRANAWPEDGETLIGPPNGSARVPGGNGREKVALPPERAPRP